MAIQEPRLLLLGPPPERGTLEAYKERYGPILKHALLDASKLRNPVLEIAVECPGATDSEKLSFDFYQSMLAHFYRLSCDICTENGIDPVKPNYVDVRIYFVGQKGDLSKPARASGPVYSFTAFGSTLRRWDLADIEMTDLTEQYLRDWVHARTPLASQLKPMELRHFAKTAQPNHAKEGCDLDSKGASHDTVILGGTFDNMHEGHKLLLTATALVLGLVPPVDPKKQRLIAGITGDQLLVNKKYAEALESWDDRQKGVFEFLRSIMSLDDSDASITPEFRNEPGPNGKRCIYRLSNGPTIECVEIQDPYGPTITEENITAIVVSGESRAGGLAVNEKRTEKGWHPLQVYEVDVLGPAGSSDLQDKISSTEKRRRRIEQAASQSKLA